MTNCTCTVTECMHNSDNCCCKSQILVDGHEACSCDSTYCASYDKKMLDSFRNTYESPDPELKIDCSAVKCVYNEGRRCTAKSVDISKKSSADGNHTRCSTFRAR